MRILVVDDEELVARSMVRLLRNHQVSVATTAERALDELRAGAWYDVILCDLHLSGLDGHGFVAQVRGWFGTDGPMLVLVSGAADIARGAADAVLHKPYTRAELEAVVDAMADRRVERGRSTTLRLARV